ncbi:hypothetical protein GCM10027079_17390 [Sediminivirga luteola]|uniref:Uncharacterized protein n=1 Tax=Sediminivirga luteola TaxID=1774748 RepID=A0A8J2TVP9_9MICO|nr:hypothetical protein GCM10011333_04860 [Sediminivirga luteola]
MTDLSADAERIGLRLLCRLDWPGAEQGAVHMRSGFVRREFRPMDSLVRVGCEGLIDSHRRVSLPIGVM